MNIPPLVEMAVYSHKIAEVANLRNFHTSVLVDLTLNNCQAWHDGGIDQQFLDEYNDRPHQGLAVPGLSPNGFARRIRNR